MATFGAALAIASYLKLPETHPPERRPRLHVPELTRTALRVAGHSEFLLLALAMGANFATMMCFIVRRPPSYSITGTYARPSSQPSFSPSSAAS